MPRKEHDPLQEAVRTATEAIGRIAKIVDAIEPPRIPPLETALRLHTERRVRDASFPAALFGEPAWDMLLALFIAGEQEQTMTITQTWAAGGVGAGTGSRVVERLEEQGLVSRHRAAGRKVQYLTLTASAREQMISYLEQIG